MVHLLSIFFFYAIFKCTTVVRRNEEIKRLNDLYVDIVPVKMTLQKCIKYFCQTEPYRMLKDWSYDMEADPLTASDEPAPTPEMTEVLYIKFSI